MTAPPDRGTASELGRFLEIQNLGLNLSFALAFLVLAARGLPNLWTFALVVVAFVAARNAGHSFNRWADREQDRLNPRTQGRALVTGRFSPGFSLALTAGNAAVLIVAAGLLNPLALALAPVALALILGYSYTKRLGWGTTVYLGLVESITPAAAFVAVRGALPWEASAAVVAMLLWGTAFETVHSLGDLASDARLGLASLPVRLGVRSSVRAVAVLHAASLGAFAVFGGLERLSLPYFLALGAIGTLAANADRRLFRDASNVRTPFRTHMLLGAIFLAGVAVSVFLPGLLPLP
ncbi:MAG TPA: UbiA family prenyltransferase [Thermoplasmata archaeon]|nr:UbiA family prenyltransferase [Thermoplasmata archaeon]